MSTRSPTRPCARPLKKNALQPHRRRMWCIPDKPSAEFVFHLEDVLEVYHRPYDPKRPVVCVDETFKQLIGETRAPLPPRPGSVERVDHVYTRNGGCEPVPGLRTPRGLAPSRGDGPPLPKGLGLVHPCAAGGALSGRGEAGAGDGPAQHPFPGQPL